MDIIERLAIRVVAQKDLPADWHEITVPVHLEDPLLASMWSTLKSCEALATVNGSYLTFWRLLPELTQSQKYRKQFGELTRIDTGTKMGARRSYEPLCGAWRVLARWMGADFG